MRKFIVANFVLGTWVKVFGKTFHTLRAPRIILPIFTITALVVITDPLYPRIQWWDVVLLSILFTSFWLGFNFFTWSYFTLYPVQYSELDQEQKHDFLRGIKAGKVKNPEQDGKYGFLTKKQAFEYEVLTKIMEDKYSGRVAGLRNLIPLGLCLLAIVIWYNWIFPHFN